MNVIHTHTCTYYSSRFDMWEGSKA